MSASTPYARVIVHVPQNSAAYSMVKDMCKQTGTASALQHSQDEQRSIRILQGQSNVGGKVDGECQDVERSPPCSVSQITDD